MPWICVCSMPIFAFFLIVSHTEPPPVLFAPSALHSLLSYSYCSPGKLAYDWLAGGLEAAKASAIVFGHTQTENQKIEEWLLSKYGRVQTGPSDVIRIVFNLHILFCFGGPIRLLEVKRAPVEGL